MDNISEIFIDKESGSRRWRRSHAHPSHHILLQDARQHSVNILVIIDYCKVELRSTCKLTVTLHVSLDLSLHVQYMYTM